MQKISTSNAPSAIGPYSQGMVVNGVVYTSGQIPAIPATGEIAGETIAIQAKQVMENLGGVLQAGGSDYDAVFKTTCFLADMADFVAFNEVYATYFPNCPARSCVAVKTLPKNVLVEVEAIGLVK
ncbi:Rid family detoxifying hydrolase [Bengtsoniella intestinalis]|uniref:Rid family detoxifying hydrolase n=1 Tax=Bengtsoniella intestinalis TaxID=3073143 RepID=UPI00391F4470